jgi:HPt (histidine-containing phosphotransfer) domain-containing protein
MGCILLEAFLGDFPNLIRALKSYADAENVEDFRRQAHSVKGAAAAVSAIGIRTIAERLEKDAKSGKLSNVPESLESLQAAYENFRKRLTITGWIASQKS